MTRHLSRRLPAFAAAGLGLALSGCTFGGPKSAQELGTEDYCRQAANRAYDLQHRERLIADDQSGTPFSSSGMVSNPSAGLSDQYAHEQRVDDCIARKTPAARAGSTFGAQ